MRTLGIAIVLFCIIVVNGQPENPVKNEEIRNAILSLVHSNSLIDQKLERHEQRERALGELIKKGLMTLQKNQKIFEPIKGSFDRLDKRVSEIETMLLTNEKQTREQQNKLTNLLEKILNAFEASTSAVSNRIADGMDEDDETLPKKINDLTDMVRELRREIGEMKADQDTLEVTNKNLVAQAEELVKNRNNQAEVIAKKLEEKLNGLGDLGRNTEFETKIATALSEIKFGIKELRTSGSSGLSEADKAFLKELTSDTKDSIQDMRLEVLTASDKSFAKTATRIKETHDAVEEVSKAFSEFSVATEAYYSESQRSGSNSIADDEKIQKLEKIMLDTSNNVLETKRRFEYGIHQIILEVGDVMKTANSSMQKRLNELNDGILENHNNALVNLSSKIETEMSQVWRQIGIMYQEITSSKRVLDHLQEQTEMYVNGSITTMDSMEGKVGLITNRMQEVDSNLNYLLGRLSLVTQEFNQIKFGLGEALDNIRSSFMTVQDKVKQQNVGPGPHQIPEEAGDEHSVGKRSFPFNLKFKRNAK